MESVMSVLYEAYVETIKDGALDVAEVLDQEIEDLANETQLATTGGIG
jgi:hypothetical protein